MNKLDLREKAGLLRTLGHPTRLAILLKLNEGVKCVTDIQDLLDIPQSNVSQHLLALRREKIVDFQEEGKLRCYYLCRPKLVKRLLRFLDDHYPILACPSKKAHRGMMPQESVKVTNDCAV
ncbi:MAG: metalloregulator ArsR/SmtB family transcription factor [Candidatus Omnitrophota bacterium]